LVIAGLSCFLEGNGLGEAPSFERFGTVETERIAAIVLFENVYGIKHLAPYVLTRTFRGGSLWG
jgi:hypothetical protein